MKFTLYIFIFITAILFSGCSNSFVRGEYDMYADIPSMREAVIKFPNGSDKTVSVMKYTRWHGQIIVYSSDGTVYMSDPKNIVLIGHVIVNDKQ